MTRFILHSVLGAVVVLITAGSVGAAPEEPIHRISGIVATNTYAMHVLTAKGAVELRQEDVPIGDRAAIDKGNPTSGVYEQEPVRYDFHVTWRVTYEVMVTKADLKDAGPNPARDGCVLDYKSSFSRSIKPDFGGRPFGEHRLGAQRLLTKAGVGLDVNYSLNASKTDGWSNETMAGTCPSLSDQAEKKAAEIEAGLHSLSEILAGFENLGLRSRIRKRFADADVSFGTVVPSTEVSIQGGNVDQVLLATYRAMDSLGSLGKRTIRAHDIGISLADHLYRTRVLFSRYPALFDEFLGNFDERNKLRTVSARNPTIARTIARLLDNQNSEREAIRGLVKTAYEEGPRADARASQAASMFAEADVLNQIFYQTGGEIIVPDLHIRISETAVPVEVSAKTSPLGRRVREIGLYRTIDERTGRHIAFSQNWAKVRATLNANEFLVGKLGIPADWKEATASKVKETSDDKKKRIELQNEIGRRVSDFRDGTISFPADVVSLLLPNSVLARPPRTVEIQILQAFLDKENVFSIEGAPDQKPETGAAAGGQLASVSVEEAKQFFGDQSECLTDHHALYSLPNLRAVGISADNHQDFMSADGYVAVIDKFAIPTDIAAQRQRDRIFAKVAHKKGAEAIDAMFSVASVLGIPIKDVRDEVRKHRDKAFDEFYLLNGLHDEFKAAPSNGLPIIASAAQHKFIDQDHGFHVSSVIGGKCNRFGVVGVAPNVKIHAYNGLDKNIDSQKALKDYFRHSKRCKKPCIVNASFSIYNKTKLTNLVVRVLEDPEYVKGVLLIAAAGQEWVKVGGVFKGIEICTNPRDTQTWRAPACLGDHPNVLTVTGARPPDDPSGPYQLQPEANFGPDTVWLAAPGIDVLGATASPLHYSSQDGTSVAAAFVTGVSAVLKQLTSDLSPCQLKARLAYTADLHVGLEDKVKFGWLNGARATEYVDRDLVIMNTGSGAEKFRVGRLGFIDYESYEMAGKIPDDLYLYEDGKNYDVGGDRPDSILLSDVRRISQQADGRYTVVYADSTTGTNKSPCEMLKIRRDVRLSPKGMGRNFLGDERIYHSFGIIADDGGDTKTNIHEIKEVIVRALMD